MVFGTVSTVCGDDHTLARGEATRFMLIGTCCLDEVNNLDAMNVEDTLLGFSVAPVDMERTDRG